jgi:transglutaminase superfamily protein
VIGLSLVFALVEGVRQHRDARYIKGVVASIFPNGAPADARARVVALREYVRTHVSWQGLPLDADRPFLRFSAAEILRTGKGYCGESTRVFIVLAAEAGIAAQRINLWGAKPHVVAEVRLSSQEDPVLVDAQNPPQIVELETLDKVIERPEYDDYYTLNLRRLHLNWLVSRVKLRMGALTYWTENPHALRSALYVMLAMGIVLMKLGRRALRAFLHRRGWIHVSALPVTNTAAVNDRRWVG